MTEIKKKRLTAKVKEEYANLVKKIRFYNEKYEAGESVVTDYEYDQLMLSLKEFEKTWPGLVGSSSPTQTVGAAVKREAGVTVTHNVPMLSIQDVFNILRGTEDRRTLNDASLRERRTCPRGDPRGWNGRRGCDAECTGNSRCL